MSRIRHVLTHCSRRYWAELATFFVVVLSVSIILGTGLIKLDLGNPEDLRNLILSLAALGALPLAVWRSRSGQRQADATRDQADATGEQARNAVLARLNDQFSNAATMLGHDAVAVRRIGIQSLQNLALDHPEVYYVRVLRTLCDYAREPFPGEKVTILGGSPRLRSDIQGAVQAIGNIWNDENAKHIGRTAAKELTYVPNLIGADLSYARFWSLNLSYAHFGDAICIGAVFGKVNFTKVNLAGANLTDADFTGESIDDRESKEKCLGLTQQQVDLACADPNTPPTFAGIIDPTTKKEITWQGRPCPPIDDEA